MKKWHFFVILLLFPVLITSCSKNDNNPAGTENQDVLSIPNLSFKGPNTFSKDLYVTQTKTHISFVNNYAQIIISPFLHAQPSKSGKTWTWVFEAGGGATETLTGSKNTDGIIFWQLILNGNVYGHDYSSWKILDGTTSADGKNGNLTLYDEQLETSVNKLSWNTDEKGVISGTLTSYSFSLVTGKKEVLNRPDNSGELTVYGDNGVITFESIWKTDGSGDWKTYTNGQESASGSWK